MAVPREDLWVVPVQTYDREGLGPVHIAAVDPHAGIPGDVESWFEGSVTGHRDTVTQSLRAVHTEESQTIIRSGQFECHTWSDTSTR